MMFYRAYLISEEGIRYREAWADEENSEFVVHHGKLGHMGDTKEQKYGNEDEAQELLDIFQQQCDEDGYQDVEDLDLGEIKVSWQLRTENGTERDRSLAIKARHSLSAHLAWRGLGEIKDPENPIFGGRTLTYFIETIAPHKAVQTVIAACREYKLDPTKVRAEITRKALQQKAD